MRVLRYWKVVGLEGMAYPASYDLVGMNEFRESYGGEKLFESILAVVRKDKSFAYEVLLVETSIMEERGSKHSSDQSRKFF